MFDMEKLIGEFHPENALEIERLISTLHRAKGSYEYLKAVELIKNYTGVGNIISYPMDRVYETWKAPVGFNIIKGHLKIISPKEKYILKDATLEPIRVIFLSGNSRGIKRFRVIDVGTGEEDEDWQRELEKKIPSIRDFLYELLNFLEVGYTLSESATIAKKEFGIKEDISKEVDYFIQRLKDQGLITLQT